MLHLALLIDLPTFMQSLKSSNIGMPIGALTAALPGTASISSLHAFTARDVMLSAVYAVVVCLSVSPVCLSVCLSVCVSVSL